MATVTKIIDSYGTPGVNCDFVTIDDWVSYVAAQSNPDQIGMVRGEHSDPQIDFGSFTSFTTPTTQDACPRLIADPSWQAGYAFYSGTAPSGVPFIYNLSAFGTFIPGNMQHFKLQGLQTDYLYLSFSAENVTNAGIWLDSVCVGVLAQINAYSSAYVSSDSTVRLLMSNCLFIGDGSSECFSFSEYFDPGNLSVAFIHTVIAKGTSVGWNGSNLLVYVINCVEMSKEDSGFQCYGPSLTVAGNASYPPYSHEPLLNPAYALDDAEFNSGVLANSFYYYSDYRLPPGSPLIDIGVTPVVPGWNLTALKDVAGTVRPRGSGFDIGLYEYPSAILDTSDLLLCF